MHGTGEREKGWHFGRWLGAAAGAYLIPFVALLFDEFVFETRLNRRFGAEFQTVVEVVYAPLLYLFDRWFY